MKDYEPIDLSNLCNAGVELIDRDPPAPIGAQSFHGLPFVIAADAARCFIGFDGDRHGDAVTVPVGQPARRVLFAHALLESR